MNWGYDYRYSYTFDHDANMIYVDLEIYNVRLSMHIRVILPDIGDRNSLNEHEETQWDNYLKILLEHENDHVRIIKENFSAEEFSKDISSLDKLVLEYDDSDDIDNLVRDAVQRETGVIGSWWFDEINFMNDRYDEMTGHGNRHNLREAFFDQ